MNMSSRFEQQVICFPAGKTTPMGYLPDPASINKFLVSTSSKKSEQSNGIKSIFKRKKTNGFTSGARDQTKVRPKLTETVKRKLSLGARILQVGGLEKIYKRLFRVSEDEKLLKTYHCYLSTTAGPIAGLLFVSSKKMAFCSERSIKVASPQGDMIRVHYKVSIPLCKIERVNPSQNTKKPSQKYVEVVTVDGFDFWFMGFLSYQKAFNCLEKALSLSFEHSEEQ
ncbi:GEM-like protein 4 [Eutrema salsugineum]|nr:GEM-like protein 4 [Eutrema salsugineum]